MAAFGAYPLSISIDISTDTWPSFQMIVSGNTRLTDILSTHDPIKLHYAARSSQLLSPWMTGPWLLLCL